jgi:hypothetical protein
MLAVLCTGCWGGVSGTIVDQYGQPIPDVQFRMTRYAASAYEFDSYGGEEGELIADGRFSAWCWSCTAVHLFFYKEGYHSESLDLAIYEWKYGLRIVMQRAEEPVSLREHQSHLEAGPDVVDTVMVIERDRTRELPLERIAAHRNPAPYLVLRPSIAADGSLATEQVGLFLSPGPAVLDFSAAGRGAGVQAYEPSTRDIRRAYREMTTAPVAGYESSLFLEAGAKEQFFYCRIARHSCKGRVTAPRIAHRGGGRLSVELSVELYLNPEIDQRSLDDPSR